MDADTLDITYSRRYYSPPAGASAAIMAAIMGHFGFHALCRATCHDAFPIFYAALMPRERAPRLRPRAEHTDGHAGREPSSTTFSGASDRYARSWRAAEIQRPSAHALDSNYALPQR